MKIKVLIALFALSISLFSGCTTKNAPNNQNQNQGQTTNATDAVTSASIVDNPSAFQKAVGTSGTWIICLTKDLTIDKELVLEGEYKNGKKDTAGKDIIQRKVALYAQDANKNITARYTLAIPKFTITSPEASLQHGNFKGDLYVSAKNFQLIDTKVEGNVYFTTDEAKSSFKMDKDSSVSGKQELKK